MRPLTPSEITRLESNGCRCSDWNRISLRHDEFDPGSYAGVWFSGDVTLGATLPSALPGISNVHLHDCELGDNVTIHNVHLISGYTIGNGATLTRCGTITADGWNPGGILVNVLDETGSKARRIHPGLTAQMAALAIDNDEDRTLINTLPLSAEHNPVRPAINHGATLSGASLIKSSIIGAHATIGHNAIIENSIIESGATVDKGTQITNCFTGQSVTLSNFTAQHSLFFANTHLCNGEAASVFAGPFTVSEHKSTLLIGGSFMMFNAGSGTNQSNHLYKLGPIHHGSMGRGCKCASDSYIMWPARIGDFTMVSGRHYTHPDTRKFPFSYLIAEADGRSRLLPGENLCKCGTARDIAKWPARDRRHAGNRLDIISHDAPNAAITANITKALSFIEAHSNATSDIETDGVLISPHALRKAHTYYTNAIMRYAGSRILAAAESGALPGGRHCEEWTDLAGYVIPSGTLRAITGRLRQGDIADTAALAAAIAGTQQAAAEEETKYALSLAGKWMERFGILPGETETSVLLRGYLQAEEEYLALVLGDAAREAKMAGRPALAEEDPTLDALKKRLINLRTRVARLSERH